MHFLLLSQYFPPETGSAPIKMAELADYLIAQGHEVSVVSQIPCYPAGVVYPGYEGAWFRREVRSGVRITRTWSYASPERYRFMPRFLNYTTYMLTALAGILSGPRPDLVFVYSPPLFLGVTASIVKKVWGCPFVFWVNDLFPLAALSLGFMRQGPLYQMALATARFIYRNTARIFVYSKQRGEELVADGASPASIEYHPLWIDTDVFQPDPDGGALIRQQFGWEGKFIVLYGGIIALAQGLEVMIESARMLRDVPEIHFVLVGSGMEKERLMNMAKDLELPNVEFVDHQPKEKVRAFFSAADLLFAQLKEAPHRVGTIPEKILAYMACGRPVLVAAQEGAARDVVREHGCGLTAPPENPEALTQAILSVYYNREEIQQMGLKGRQAAETYFAGPKVLKAMESSFLEIARKAAR
jgi:colanic acid biosynthesis glycosyl transferase WcaI